MLVVDGTPQSYVDVADPTYLLFEYVRWLGHAADLVAPAGEPIAAVHLGAGALTLARYVAATRPGSRQRAVEVSARVAELVRAELPLPRGVRAPVQVADAREAAGRMRAGSAALVVLDTFEGARAPGHLTSVEMVRVVHRLLVDGGVVATNLADGPGLRFVRGQVSTYGEVFRHVAVVAEPPVWHGRRFGNVVLLASDARLPIEDLGRRCAGDAVPARVVHGEALRRFVGGAAVVTDATAEPSPAPPLALFGRRTRRR